MKIGGKINLKKEKPSVRCCRTKAEKVHHEANLEENIHFVNGIIDKLMCETWTRFNVLHLCPIMLSHVFVLINAEPEKKIKIDLIIWQCCQYLSFVKSFYGTREDT